MPELPEVNALVEFLNQEVTGSVVAAVELASFSVLKTYDPPVAALQGLEVTYSQSSLQYCPTCQTHGAPLKDRTTSKFLK